MMTNHNWHYHEKCFDFYLPLKDEEVLVLSAFKIADNGSLNICNFSAHVNNCIPIILVLIPYCCFWT